MLIRKIKPVHLKEVYEISTQQFGSESWTMEQFRDSIQDDNYICVALLYRAKVVSYVIAIQTLDDINILSVATKEEFKKQGLATQLINWYKELSLAVEKTLSLEVKSQNTPALNLYTKLGFCEVSKRKNYYKDGDTAIVMFLKK